MTITGVPGPSKSLIQPSELPLISGGSSPQKDAGKCRKHDGISTMPPNQHPPG
jgi:hypothetical protein